MIMNISTSEGVKSVAEYVPSAEYAAMIARRREAAARLKVTPQQRDAIRRSKRGRHRRVTLNFKTALPIRMNSASQFVEF